SGVRSFESDLVPESDTVSQIRDSGSDLAPESDTVSQIRDSGSDLAPESDTISRVRGSGADLAPKSDAVSRIRGSLSDLTKTIRLPPYSSSASTYSLSSAFARTLALPHSFVVAGTPAPHFCIRQLQSFHGAALPRSRTLSPAYRTALAHTRTIVSTRSSLVAPDIAGAALPLPPPPKTQKNIRSRKTDAFILCNKYVN